MEIYESAADFELFKKKKNRVTYLLKEVKSVFLTEYIDQIADNQGKLLRAVKGLLVEKKTLCFSNYQDTKKLANELGLYFAQKVANLCDELDLVSMTMNAVPDYSDDSRAPLVFEEFVLLTDDYVCMINTSLELGVFPKDWKEAVVVPSLKKLSLNPLITNLRPVSIWLISLSLLNVRYLIK